MNKNRNFDLLEKEIEKYISDFGVLNFIWLDGVFNLDIMDFYIDGFVKFYNKFIIVMMKEDDLVEWGLFNKDMDILLDVKNVLGQKYKYEYLLFSKEKVVLENGKIFDYKGLYINYYIGNIVVLVFNYNDLNDKIVNDMIQKLYLDCKVVGIDVRELYKNGGMIYCVI